MMLYNIRSLRKHSGFTLPVVYIGKENTLYRMWVAASTQHYHPDGMLSLSAFSQDKSVT